MLNLEVEVSSFWQLARHWKSGHKAKLELECEGGDLHLHLAAKLGHPDHEHFPAPSSPPPPQPSFKTKSSSQLRRQKRRREEALTKAKKAAAREEVSSHHSEKDTCEDITSNNSENHNPVKMTNSEEATLSKSDLRIPVETPHVEYDVFKCDHCDHKASCKASLKIHGAKEHKRTVRHERFKCDNCNENMDTKNSLNNHMIIEHGHIGEVFSCDYL